jgi:2-polyprenyl-6-methoxyphenol hydroxylase-like FAD-dependent oxidoreductase
MITTDVLVVGAGPTGLMLAGWLAREGVRALVVDTKTGPVKETRAIGVQARTMEVYDQLGLGQRALAEGVPALAVNVIVSGKSVARAVFNDMGKGISPHPYMFILTQDRNEALLLDHLKAHGGDVRWQTELTALEQSDAGVSATLRLPDGTTETVQARYVCGCDGAASVTRHAVGIGFPGGTYDHLFYVADVVLKGAVRPGELNLCLQEHGFAAFFPLPGTDHFRIVGLVPDEDGHHDKPNFELIRPALEANFKVEISATNWFSTYRVHHRVAETFQRGRVFLLGDAAHVHSPVGGQGMNTGLMDAANLAWKLARVLRGEAEPKLLESYGAERIPFAKSLVNTTDRVFSLVINASRLGRLARTFLAPRFFPLMASTPVLRRLAFGVISQIRVNYHNGPLSRGEAGGVAAGDRLPWVPFPDGTSNFDALKSLKPQLHVYGDEAPPASAHYAVHLFPFTQLVNEAGILKNALYLVRPDGYVGLAMPHGGSEAVEAYLRETLGLRTSERKSPAP